MLRRLLSIFRRPAPKPDPVRRWLLGDWLDAMRGFTAAELRAVATDENESCDRRAAARQLLLGRRA